MKCAVHIFPSIADRTDIDDVRSKYDPLSGKIPPHITLVFPFDYDLSTELLISHVQFVASDYQAFDITFGEPEFHDTCVWLPTIEGREKIQAIHASLYTDILKPHLSSMHCYTPHLTLARVAQEQSDAYTYVQKIKTGTKGAAERIIVERILADDSSDIVASIPLK